MPKFYFENRIRIIETLSVCQFQFGKYKFSSRQEYACKLLVILALISRASFYVFHILKDMRTLLAFGLF